MEVNKGTLYHPQGFKYIKGSGFNRCGGYQTQHKTVKSL